MVLGNRIVDSRWGSGDRSLLRSVGMDKGGRMKLASTVIWMLWYALLGVFAVWAVGTSPDIFDDVVSAREAIAIFCLVYVVSFSIRRIGELEHEHHKKDKG